MFNDLIKDLELSDEVKNSLKTNFEKVYSDLKETVENDPAIVKKHKTGAFEEAKRKLKNALNLEKDEVADLDIDAVINLAKTRINETVSKSDAEKDKEILKYKQELQRYETEVIPSIKDETVKQIKNFKFENKLSDVVAGIQTLGSKDSAKIILKARLSQFNVDVDDSGNVTVLTKDGLKPTIDNKVVTDLNEISKHILLSEGLVIQNNNGAQAPKGSGVQGDSSKLPPAVLAKMEQIKNLQTR
jgi:hypothetical protein